MEKCTCCGKQVAYDNISIVLKENDKILYWCDSCSQQKHMTEKRYHNESNDTASTDL